MLYGCDKIFANFEAREEIFTLWTTARYNNQ